MLFLDSSDWSNPCWRGEAYDRHGDSNEVLLLGDAVGDSEGTNNSGIQVVQDRDGSHSVNQNRPNRSRMLE